jgi:glycosyltransferase involved in cell wall biosynthesis
MRTDGDPIVPGSVVKPSDGYRIAFIGGRGIGAQYSGIETFYEEVGTRLAARGHDVTVYCRRHFTPAARSYRGMHVVRLPALRSKHLETLTHSLLATLHALVCHYDVVHIHAIGSSVFALVPRLFGCPTVVTVHALDWARPKWKGLARWCLRAAEWTSIAFPSRTTAVSASVAQYLETKYKKPIDVLPNGVNPTSPAPPTIIAKLGLHRRRYVLFVGRLSEEKRCHQLLEAFQGAVTDGLQLVFAGAATYALDYERRLRSLAGPAVHFLGWVDRQVLAELYSNCALFVLPSSLEGMSVALLEAMSYGAPVLVSDIPPNVEVVGDSGFLFREGDTDDLTRRLSRLLSAPESLRKVGQGARRRVQEHFSWDSVVTRLEAVYQGVLGSPRLSVAGMRTAD